MAAQENKAYADLMDRPVVAQKQMVTALLGGLVSEPLFESFRRFAGVFPLDPWKPAVRQSAQQAMFLCAADAELNFMQNLTKHDRRKDAIYRYTLPSSVREEAIRHLARMNVTAATLFPDLNGLGRSIHTYRPRRLRLDTPPWSVPAKLATSAKCAAARSWITAQSAAVTRLLPAHIERKKL